MINTISLRLLDKQIMKLRKQLDKEICQDMNNLSSPEVLAINRKIDQLIVLHIKLTYGMPLK